MAERPRSRKTHITRILGTNRAGDRLDDMWADVERIDVTKGKMQVPPHKNSVGVQRKLHWRDDPDRDDYLPEGPASRVTEIVKVCDPDSQDVDDPDEWIPIRAIKGARSKGGDGIGDRYIDRFLNALTNDRRSSRVVEVRKIVRYDTNIDDAANAAFAANPQRREFVIQSSDYVRDEASKDSDHYVEHEIVTYLKHKGNVAELAGLGRQTKMLNQFLIDQSQDPKGKVVGRNGNNPPYRLDPFQNIVNINLGATAVEFFDESYIELEETVPASKKMVWSIWFRAPKASLDAAKAEYEAWKDAGGTRAPLTGVVPIWVSGGTRTGKKSDFVTREVGTTPAVTSYIWDTSICGWQQSGATIPAQPDEESHWVFNDETRDIDPSYIGIDCSGDVPKLSVNLVMPSDNRATIEGSWPVIVTSEGPEAMGLYGTVTATDECTPPVNNHSPGDGSVCEGTPSVMPFNDVTQTDTYESNADVLMQYRPETFRTVPGNRVGDVSFAEHFLDADLAGGQEVTPDVWHHVLLSVDFSNSCRSDGVLGDDTTEMTPNTEGSRTSSACRMWIAFDDVNLTGKSMSCYWPSGYSDQNAILPVNGFFVAGDITRSFSRTVDDCHGNNIALEQVQQQPKFRYTPAAFSPGKMSFPAGSPFVAMDKHIEMGEAQLFTDVAVDTSFNVVRRAFITENGTPAGLKKASDLLGKKPEVLVHGSSNWKKARNTGSLADPNVNPGGVVVGTIKTFKPNPKLGK